jgi:hypothetical protein
MEKLALIFNFIMDLLTLGVSYKLRKKRQERKDNAETLENPDEKK